ncbi:MAG TPA: ABC transporter permease [Gaiellaceae bacterium]|nr:ABC transporter permease [Gaiellaceae bacterium]
MASLRRVLAVVVWQAASYRHVWRGSVTVSFLNPVFFLLSIGVLLGRLVDSRHPHLGGLSYLQFVAPALLATTAMQTAASMSTFSVRAGLKWLRTFHAVTATPVSVPELVGGLLAWAGVRVLFSAAVFAAIAAVGGAFTSGFAALAPLAALLCGLAFAAAITAFSSSLDNDQWLAPFFRFVLVPLFLFSGTFFPLSRLPEWIRPVAWATPLWHGVTLCRDVATGRAALLPTAGHVAYLAGLAIVGTALAVRACERRLLS